MKSIANRSLFAVLFFCTATVWAKMTPEQVKQLPPPADHKIDFTKEIKPILETSCTKCHGRGKEKGGFKFDNKEFFLKGGDSGSPVVTGKSDESLIIELVMGFDPDSVMPKKGSRLKPEQIGLLRAWIDQGLSWDPAVSFARVEAKNLRPRQPQVPAVAKMANPVDAFIDVYFKTNSVKWAKPASDAVFARRVYLDITGLLPSPVELEKFVKDKNATKREQLVDRLLADNKNYAEHWLTFWNDMLRNDYKGTGYIDGGRKQITKWLYQALYTNMPYNEFVAELVNPTLESEGFSKGIVWRGVVNASQTPQMQASQGISQVFMGLNMKCASCHDSFINDWQLADAYGLANIYADSQLEIFQCDKPTGKKASSKFLYPEFGVIDGNADKPTRMKQLAACITSEKNGRLPRTLVNRLWGRFLGRAFVEPVDDMEQAGWNTDLLDWLAEDFVAHHYDVRHLIKQIVTSRAYQLPSVNLGENAKGYVFRGPSVRRMTAEEFRDALTSLTGVGYAKADTDAGGIGEVVPKFETKAKSQWIWNVAGAEAKAKAEVVYFRRKISLPAATKKATAMIICDNSFTLFVNGKKAASGDDYTRPTVVAIDSFLKKGENVLAIEAINNLPGNEKPTAEAAKPGTENPAGLFFFMRAEVAEKGTMTPYDFSSDKSWDWSREKTDGWEKADFAEAGWEHAFELGKIHMPPWRVPGDIIAKKMSETPDGIVRASLVAADPLMVALGRPNREQVVTTRPSEATTLQALEMTNGGTLSDIVKRGAKNLTGEVKSESQLVQRIYEQGLGRKPTSGELKLAEEVVGTPVKKEGVEDLLWAMTMLPEFQLIY